MTILWRPSEAGGFGGGGIESNLSNFCIPIFIQTNFASSGTSRCWFKASCINIVDAKKIVAVKEATHAVGKSPTCRDPNRDCWLLQRSTGNWASSIPYIIRSHRNRRFCNVDDIHLSLSIQKVIEFLFMLVLGGNLNQSKWTHKLSECCKTKKLRNCRYLTIALSGEVYNQCCETLSYPICASVCCILSAGSTVEHANDTALRFIRSTPYKKTKALLLQVESTSQLRACGWIGSL